MQTLFENYIQSISLKFSHKETSEMGYRADFEILLKGIFESINVKRINHDARAEQGNKPDFVVLKGDVPIVYIEAKDIGVSLDKVEKSEQMARYYGYANLVLTDYVEFRFYRNGLRYEEPIKIANYNIKKLLVHDLTTDAFADMYAQTLVYGLFVARYHDETKKDFSRGEARDLIPKSDR